MTREAREELIEKMCHAYDYPDGPADYSVCRSDEGKRHRHEMAAALDVAVGELLKAVDADEWKECYSQPRKAQCWLDMSSDERADVLLYYRRSRYLPKRDLAVEAVKEISLKNGWCSASQSAAEQIVAAVRAADKSQA